MVKLKIAVLGIYNDVYYAKEYDTYNKNVQKLMQFADEHNFEVLQATPVYTALEAENALLNFKQQNMDYLIVLHSGFSMGDISDALEKCECPLGVWAIPEPTQSGDIKLHSFVSMNLYASVAKRCQDNTKCKWFYGDADSEMFKKRFLTTVDALRAVKALKGAKIGVIGGTAFGFYNLETDGVPYSEKYGVEFVRGTVEELADYAKKLSDKEIKEACNLIHKTASECLVSEEVQIKGAKAYLSLKNFCKTNGISALAAACWPDFQDEFGIVPCVPFTVLGTFDNIPVACEGDIGAAISMLVAAEISGKMSTIMDVAAVDEKDNAILLWHCGIGSCALQPCKEDIKIIHHPMMNRKDDTAQKFGLAYDYTFKQQPVVVSRLTDNGKMLISFSGEVIANKNAYDGTRGWIGELKHDGESVNVFDVVDTMMQEGVEHHLVISAGNCENAFLEFAALTDSPVIKVKPYKDHL